ncbi:hypothetical protein Peur_046228 [Populus x canadensis]|jgi:hypothetical protein
MEGLQNDDLQSLLLRLKEGAIADELRCCDCESDESLPSYENSRGRRVRIFLPFAGGKRVYVIQARINY